MSDPFDDDQAPATADRTGDRTVERVRARTSVTSPRLTVPVASGADDDDNIFGAPLGGGMPRPAPPPPLRAVTDPTLRARPADPPASSGPQPAASRTRSGLTVVRPAEVSTSGPRPVAPGLDPTLLPPRRVPTIPPAPTLDPALLPPRRVPSTPPGPPAPPLMSLDELLAPSGAPPPPAGLADVTTRRSAPTGRMSLDPAVAPQGSQPRPRPVTNPSLPTPRSDEGPPMAPRAPVPTGLRDDGTALSAAEAALPSLFKTPEQVQRRRIQIAATTVAGLVLAAVTVVLWVANQPPPPPTGSTQFTLADKAAVTELHLVGLTRIDADVDPDHRAGLQAVVDRVVGSVARSLGPSPTPTTTILIADADPVAWATTDGRLVLSKGLLLALTSQAELAAVAAHLLAHQRRFHLDTALDDNADALLPDLRASVRASLVTPGGTRVATVGQWHPASRQEEFDADSDAILALQRASWDATALRAVWQRLAGMTPAPAFIAQHPLSTERVRALEAAEARRLQGSDLVRGEAGRTNSVEYQAEVKDVIAPPVVVSRVEAEAAEAPAPPPSSEPMATRITTRAAEPAPKAKPPPPEAPAPPTGSSPRDAND